MILSGLPLTGDHPMHPFTIDADGHMFVDLGSATNSCQLQNRIANSPGHQPCTELETRAGKMCIRDSTDAERYFVSEASVYRLLKAHDLITSPAFIVMKAADEFKD